MEGFPITVKLEVRWADMDPLGHVNNAKYLTYLETARLYFYRDILGYSPDDPPDFILASVTCDYLAPLHFGESVEVGIRVSRVGRTSFDFDYSMVRPADGKQVAKARSVQVMYDHAGGRKMNVPESWLKKVREAQGDTA